VVVQRLVSSGVVPLIEEKDPAMSALAKADPAAIVPFQIQVSDAQIADLKERLTMTRWPAEVTADFDRGQPVSFIRELADHWLNRYDWRAHEAELNRLPQFTTVIDGQTIHFAHIKSRTAGALPILFCHGWPSSFAEYLKLVPLLGEFDLVLPSLPGFGFSTPLTSGWSSKRTARAFDTLMKRLGYDRYGFVGNDVGSAVGKEIGVLKPEGLVGVHIQQIFAFPEDQSDWGKMDEFEAAGMANMQGWEKNNGYQRIQQTRPGTLGYGLVDSPVAQLAWNAELPFGFDGNREKRADREHFLTNVSIYWFTGTGGTAANVYLEDHRINAADDKQRNDTPTGVAVFPDDFRSVRAFCEVNNNIVHWTQMPSGGHFAAVEEPKLLADDVRAFFGKIG
jgi:pimeloyl-ACP methyl ester carboxylesterase